MEYKSGQQLFDETYQNMHGNVSRQELDRMWNTKTDKNLWNRRVQYMIKTNRTNTGYLLFCSENALLHH